MRKAIALVTMLLAPAVAQAQAPASAAPGSALVGSSRTLYEQIKSHITRAAEQMPEEHYGFKPTPEVRSFGQLIGHIANAHYMFCSSVIGSASPMTENLEQTRTTKADLVQALRASFAYCDRAYQINDTQAAEMVNVFGAQQPKLYALSINVAHDNEHYGNIVTYMRLKGQVPPSSQRGGN